MSDEIRDAVVAAARGTFGATLRSVLFYNVEAGDTTESVWYLRDDVAEATEDPDARISAFASDYGVESVDPSPARELGDLRASLRVFEDAVVIRVHSYGRSGVVVSVDPASYERLTDFVAELDDYLAGVGVPAGED
jgi:hypothetical protein